MLINDVGLDEIAKRVKAPLKGKKFAPYYGCQIVRPFASFDDQYNPQTMDRLLAAAGAECVTYPLKTRCCGGSLTGTVPEVGLRLAYIILKEAKKRGAEAVVTVCPLCQFNLDGYQDQIARQFEAIDLPVVYFTQILGLALGLSAEELAFKRGILAETGDRAHVGLQVQRIQETDRRRHFRAGRRKPHARFSRRFALRLTRIPRLLRARMHRHASRA